MLSPPELAITHANLATLQGPATPRDGERANDVGMREDHTVLVQDGVVTWVGPTEEWDGEAAKTLDADGALVTPGYVDSHTHLIYGGDRAFELTMKLSGKSYMQILDAGGGIAHTTGKTREADEAELARQARGRLLRMLQNGTTALEAKSGYALEPEGELRMLAAANTLADQTGIPMAHTFLGAHAVPQDYKEDTDRFVDLVIDDMLPKVAKQGIAHYCDVFVEEGVFTVEQGERIFAAATKAGLGLRLHADEIVNTGGAQLAARAGCLTADHLLAVSDEGIEAMAEAGTIATLLPTVPITMMRPQWPAARRFLDAGVPVALASDHNPNNPVTNMSLVAQLGCYLLGLTPEQALTAVTWNGAVAIGMQDRMGKVQEGYRADLLVHNVPDVAHWAYEPGRNTVETVILGGRVRTT